MLSPSLVQQLRADLAGATVLTPGSDGYEESLKRWSETAEKRAVGLDINQHLHIAATAKLTELACRAPSLKSPPQSM